MRNISKFINFIYGKVKNDDVYELIDKNEIISFDVYDTLLQRDVENPTDLFIFLEKEIISRGELVHGFAKWRIEAENLARKRYREHTTLNNIYEVLSEIKSDFSKVEYMEMELALEIRMTSVRKDVYKMYMHAIEKKKRIFLISDMYLTKHFINKLLKINGIEGYEELFVSCEYGVSKYKGDLFELVKSKKAVSYAGWLHIGDNIVSDWFMPVIKGICSYTIERKSQNLCGIIDNQKSDSFEISQMYKYIQNRVSDKDDYYKLGYSIFGPILYGVTRWLHQCTKKDDIDIILFAARDGYLFEKAYKEISNHKKTRYILVSRKSLMLPMLSMGEPVDLYLKIFFPNLAKYFSLEFFLDKLGFSKDESGKFLSVYKYPLGKEYNKFHLLKSGEFQRIYDNIRTFFKVKISDSMLAFSTYLNIKQLEEKNIAFFDLGWRGSLQKCLECILNKEIYGYYLYTDKRVYNLKYAKGYIANREIDVCKKFYLVTLLELIFSAPHGSAKAYRLSNDGKMVVLDKYEHFDKKESECLEKIREAALMFNTDAINEQFMPNINLLPGDYFCAIKQICLKPSKKIIKLIGDFYFSDIVAAKMVYGKHDNGNIFSLLKAYKLSSWKVGFLYSRFWLLGQFFPLGKIFVNWRILKHIISKRR